MVTYCLGDHFSSLIGKLEGVKVRSDTCPLKRDCFEGDDIIKEKPFNWVMIMFLKDDDLLADLPVCS